MRRSGAIFDRIDHVAIKRERRADRQHARSSWRTFDELDEIARTLPEFHWRLLHPVVVGDEHDGRTARFIADGASRNRDNARGQGAESCFGKASRTQHLVERQLDAGAAKACVGVDARRHKADLALDRLARGERDHGRIAFLDEGELGVRQFCVEFDEAIARNAEVRRRGAARDIAGTDGALQHHAADRRAERHARLAHFHFVDLRLRGGQRGLRACGFHAALFKKFLGECALLLQRLGAGELAFLEVERCLLGREGRFSLGDLRLQQRIVQLGHRLALLHPIAFIDIDRGDAVAGKFGPHSGFFADDQTARGDEILSEIAHLHARDPHGLQTSHSARRGRAGGLLGRRRLLPAGMQPQEKRPRAGDRRERGERGALLNHFSSLRVRREAVSHSREPRKAIPDQRTIGNPALRQHREHLGCMPPFWESRPGSGSNLRGDSSDKSDARGSHLPKQATLGRRPWTYRGGPSCPNSETLAFPYIILIYTANMVIVLN